MTDQTDQTDARKELILVTGASRGLGYQVARLLAGPGTHILALARTTGALEELDDEIRAAGGSATLVPMSLTDDAALARLGLSIYERWGRLDLMVHCAAMPVYLSPVGHIEDKAFDDAMALNARATWKLISVTDPLLRAAPAGQAVFCDDPASGPFHGAYAATKAAARAIVDAYRAENESQGPAVLTFTPARMATALQSRFRPGVAPDDMASPEDEARCLVAMLGR